jgi:hypothetical protein
LREIGVQIDGGPVIAWLEDNGNRGSAILKALRHPVVRELLEGRECERAEFPQDDRLNFVTRPRRAEN